MAVLSDNVFTSEATTAKPLPNSPARAASIVAFRASKPVWFEISLIKLMTLPISVIDSLSCSIPCLVVVVTRDAFSVKRFVCCVWFEMSEIVLASSFVVSAIAKTFSVALPDSIFAWPISCSVKNFVPVPSASKHSIDIVG